MPRPAWHSEAACRGRLDVMVIPEGNGGPPTRAMRRHIAIACAVCHTCPVIAECEAWADQLVNAGTPIVGMVLAGRDPASLSPRRRTA